MQDKGYINYNSNLKAKVKRDNGPWWETIFKARDDKKLPEIQYSAGGGNHVFTYKGRTLWVHHREGETLLTGWDRTPTLQEDLFINCYGADTTIIKEFIMEAIKHCVQGDNSHIGIYELHRWGLGWTKVQSKKCRPLDSVILDEGVANRLVEDITQFQNSEKWYKDKGIPYRRGYLLHGPPGTGKTSFTQAIAGALGYNICYLNLSGNTLDDDGLNRALNDAPAKSIILLEDIDGIFVARESVTQSNDGGRHVSFSGLLNALDGVRSQEGRILFMTTNHREKLDPALMRPGRADVHVLLNNASNSQLQRLFLNFFPEEKQMAKNFAQQLPEFKMSMAKMQGHFLKYRDQPKDALANIKELLAE